LQCKSLSDLYGSSVFAQNTTVYSDFTGAYWSSIQSALHPLCIFKPSKAADISVLVLLARLTQCPFAFKSGGHAAFAGASSIEGGITVSLENFKDVTVSRDKKTVKIQPGNSWVDVYKVLDPQDITVTGGRVARVGTGGLTLGGKWKAFSSCSWHIMRLPRESLGLTWRVQVVFPISQTSTAGLATMFFRTRCVLVPARCSVLTP